MPIKSYIAVPKDGRRDALIDKLKEIERVHADPSENRDVVVLVTDTPDEDTDKQLFNTLKELDDIQMITLVSAFSDTH